MTAKTNTNGQVRKSLADQIDRLDSMLDGLAEGLNDAVAAAVKDAVGAAVQTVLREVLANPEMLARLGAAAPVAVDPAPTVETPLEAPKANGKQHAASIRQTLAAWAAAARMQCRRRLAQAQRAAAGVWERVRVLHRMPYLLLTTVAVGVTAGVARCFARPWLAAAFTEVGGVAAMAALQVRAAWRRLTAPVALSPG